MIIHDRRFKKFDPQIHREEDRDSLFGDFVEVQDYVIEEKENGVLVTLFNPEWHDAPYVLSMNAIKTNGLI